MRSPNPNNQYNTQYTNLYDNSYASVRSTARSTTRSSSVKASIRTARSSSSGSSTGAITSRNVVSTASTASIARSARSASRCSNTTTTGRSQPSGVNTKINNRSNSVVSSTRTARFTPTTATTTTATTTTATAGSISIPSITSTPAFTPTKRQQSLPRTRPPPSNPPLIARAFAKASAHTLCHDNHAPVPLRSRDPNQNVHSLIVKTRSTSNRISKMPLGERPRQPQLSAAAAKVVNRTPLTPKVATIKSPALVTPLGRRSHNPNVATATTATSASSTPTALVIGAYAPYRDEVPAPVAPFLTNNVTPRSGSRQNRVDSTNTTPVGTPNPEKASDMWDANNRGASGMSPLALSDGHRQSSSQGDSPGDSSNESTKFFYASEARNPHQSSQPRPASILPRPMSNFFYASEATVSAKRMTSPPMNPTASPPPTLSPPQESVASKFFYANGTPDMPSRPTMPTSGSGSNYSSSSKMTTGRPSTGNSAVGFGAPGFQRPVSPLKAVPAGQTAWPSIASPPSPTRLQAMALPLVAPAINANIKRRISADAPSHLKKGHARTGSVPNFEPHTLPKFVMPIANSPSELTSPPLSPGSGQTGMTMASLLQIADEWNEDEEEEEEEEEEETNDEDSELGDSSPSKSAHFSDSVNDLITNARRERKVQDLEITNASLEAINRTLERQLRKQTVELRRYRRLSRAGHLSLASAASSRMPSEAFTEPPVDLSDLSEREEGMDEDDLDSMYDSESSLGSHPETKIDARRKRDENRLQLDLTKHQELLIDSQRMNQSLIRCLDWTEVLIKEGQKALEYTVKISEVEVGGRILGPVDEDDRLSHHTDNTLTSLEPSLEPPWTKPSQDRDSGIELPADGV